MIRTGAIVFDTDRVHIDSEELRGRAKRIASAHAGTRTFPAHELIEAGAHFTFEDFLSLKQFLSVPEREASRD